MERKIIVIGIVAVVIIAAFSATALLLMGNSSSSTIEKKANFVVTSLTLDRQNVLLHQQVKATIVMMNNGTAEGNYTLNLTMDGQIASNEVVKLGPGNSTSFVLNFYPSSVGNHTISAMNASTFVNCYDSINLGDYLKYHMTGYDSYLGTIDGNATIQVISVGDTTYTENMSYSGIDLPFSVTTHSIYEQWSDGLQNLTKKGMENVLTCYGAKSLSHFTYTYDSGSYHYVYDLYVDETTGIKFRIVGTYGASELIMDLVDTNKPWVADI